MFDIDVAESPCSLEIDPCPYELHQSTAGGVSGPTSSQFKAKETQTPPHQTSMSPSILNVYVRRTPFRLSLSKFATNDNLTNMGLNPESATERNLGELEAGAVRYHGSWNRQ